MAKVIKNVGKEVVAYRLGACSKVELELSAKGLICYHRDNNTYELFSQESNDSGEIALPGDYFKVDNAGFPYPNEATWFEANHRHINGDRFEQVPKALTAWEATEPLTEEVAFLLNEGKLKLHPEKSEEYFGATLWGAWLTAASDAILVFYSVTRDDNGVIIDADFNFVARKEFEATYHYC